MRNLPFSIPGYTCVVADVFVPDVTDTELGTVVEDA